MSRFSLPGARRVPRPTIWQKSARTFVARSTQTQSTSGQSHPSVRSMELRTTVPGPASAIALIFSWRSGDWPFISIVRRPAASQYGCKWRLVAMSGVKTTVFRSFGIADAICGRYGSRAAATPPAWKSPFCMATPFRLI